MQACFTSSSTLWRSVSASVHLRFRHSSFAVLVQIVVQIMGVRVESPPGLPAGQPRVSWIVGISEAPVVAVVVDAQRAVPVHVVPVDETELVLPRFARRSPSKASRASRKRSAGRPSCARTATP